MASTTVDELVVKIKADVGQLNKQLSQIQAKSGTVGKQAGANLAAMGAGAAVAQMGAEISLGPLQRSQGASHFARCLHRLDAFEVAWCW